MPYQPGPLALFGSGETAATGRKVFDEILQRLPSPARVAIVETPSGFEPNSEAVVRRIAEFLQHGLQNYSPEIYIVPARQRGTAFSPDSPELAELVLTANCIVLGPGSPTYAVRQLRGSIMWDAIRVRFAEGAALVLASASVLAVSSHTLPVYEIYKAGADLGWVDGLDLLGAAGLNVAFVPHWNNHEGGADLDTSRCFMGVHRFERLQKLLPSHVNIVGIDEHTALIFDLGLATGRVMGRGGVTIEREGKFLRCEPGEIVSFDQLGSFDWDSIARNVPANLSHRARELEEQHEVSGQPSEPLPTEVRELVERRNEARSRRDWSTADAIRDELAALGYELRDTPNGSELNPMN